MNTKAGKGLLAEMDEMIIDYREEIARIGVDDPEADDAKARYTEWLEAKATVEDYLAAIEAEAVAAERARISLRVRELPSERFINTAESMESLIARVAVLAIIENEP